MEFGDEFFYVAKGRMRIELEQQVIHLGEGDFFTVPRGVRHNPIADEECWIMLIEPASTKHTGDEIIPQTRSLDEQLA
ncbi:cupin domain-containing protein [Dyella sp.]|uniref:cupin domain-containing protein n=1 Tax=Dyella sp. TaxID=1869338 RepID=UPI002FDAF490